MENKDEAKRGIGYLAFLRKKTLQHLKNITFNIS